MGNANCQNCGAVILGRRCEYCGTWHHERDYDVEVLWADGRPAFEIVRDAATGKTEIYGIGEFLNG